MARPRKRNVRNSKFQDECLTGLSWTVVENGKFGHRRKAVCCQKLTKVGDIILAAPAIRDGGVVGTTFMHAKCVRELLKLVPEDMDLLRARWSEIRDKHIAA